MPSPSSNKAIIASAGSGKTEEIVVRALAVPTTERVLLTTYTDNGANEIRARLTTKSGRIPSNIEVLPWLTFLLNHGVRPYQHPLVGTNEVTGLHFERRQGFPKKSDARTYYLDRSGNAYRDYLAEFAVMLDAESGGAVVERISQIYHHIFYDEVQDISGRDFEFLELLMASQVSVTVVGDPRQGTFSTTQSRTNRGLTKSAVMKWVGGLEDRKVLEIEIHDYSMRCNQHICDFADDLYPELPRTQSRNTLATAHDGVFLLKSEDVAQYVSAHAPQLLVWNRRSESFGLHARNMGDSKGLTFDRVLISPTATMEKFLQSGAPLAPEALAKFYVAVTRARHSVAIVLEHAGSSTLQYWTL
jgi:DNA helicase II / ATP-dependent DNA helicase PcrA